jgi:hypothetical protein
MTNAKYTETITVALSKVALYTKAEPCSEVPCQKDRPLTQIRDAPLPLDLLNFGRV